MNPTTILCPLCFKDVDPRLRVCPHCSALMEQPQTPYEEPFTARDLFWSAIPSWGETKGFFVGLAGVLTVFGNAAAALLSFLFLGLALFSLLAGNPVWAIAFLLISLMVGGGSGRR